MVPSITVDDNAININGNSVTLTLSWGEPFNNFDPIVNYAVSCSGDVTCPPNFTTTDNTTRSYTITNLTTMTTYTFSVVATNSVGSGQASVVMITTPGKATSSLPTYICTYIMYAYTNNYISVHVLLIIAIDQVTGVMLMCESVGLINQCTVMWNVSVYEVISYVLCMIIQ